MPDSSSAATRETLRRLGPAGIVALAWGLLPLAGLAVLGWNLQRVTAFLTEDRPRGLAVFIAGFAVCAGLGLLPTWAQSLIGGWAFGFKAGGPAVLAAIILASWIGFEVARGASRDRVERVIEERPKWRAVRDSLVGTGFWRTAAIVALVRLPPNSPFAVTNLVLASAGVPRAAYLLGTAAGIAPRTLVTVFIGSTIRVLTAQTLSQTPRWIVVMSVVLTLVAVAVIGSIGKRAVDRVTNGMPARGPRESHDDAPAL
jgi:uncharacterized membrane protein YdjX (TVP38/TMEM64 family)